MDVQRHRGYVIGFDVKKDKRVWRVKVKDSIDEYNGMKFDVASVHQGIELAQGLNVTFLTGTMDIRKGQKEYAVDVRLEEG